MPFIPPEDIALMIPIIALSIPIVAIWTSHKQKMAQILANRGTTLAPDVRAELNQLRDEVIALRETTTRFDMSFDAALTHLEDRMDASDNGLEQPEPLRRPVTVPIDEHLETLTAGRGRG